MAELEVDELVLNLPRGSRGALRIRRCAERDGIEFVALNHFFPDEQSGDLKPARGVHLKHAEIAAVGAALLALAEGLKAREEKAKAAGRDTPAAPPPPPPPPPPTPEAAAVQVLPKTAAVFIGVRHRAQRGGVCVVCGSNVLGGDAYLWSEERQAGAHLRCGQERPAPAPAQRSTAPRQCELPGARRQPQDDQVGRVPDDERKLAEELF